MKKALKVGLYFLGSVVLLVSIILIFHNAIISFVLKTVIENKSDGKVSLNIGDFDFNLLEGSILITDPELVMKELYLNETKNMSLDRVVFDKIKIDLFDLKLLFIKRNISANKFLIDKPEFWFTEQGTSEKSSFHPDKLFEALQYNPGIFKTLQVQIGDIEIHYGSINISEQTHIESDPGVVDFTILLHDFNTTKVKDSLQNRILFSEEMRFKLRNLKRVLKSGYTLKIDSALFSTKKRDLEIGGAKFIPGKENLKTNAVELYAGKLILTDIGLEEVRGLEDLGLSAVHISDGYFISYLNRNASEKSEQDSNSGIKSLEKLFYEFSLDSITLSRFNYYNIFENSDTTILANNVNFLITGIKIDSGMFDDPFRDFIYDTIKLTTGSLELKRLIPGFNFNYHNLSYSNRDRNLNISGITVKSDSSASSDKNLDITLRNLGIKGFSLKRFQKQKVQRLTVTVDNPEINLDLAQLDRLNKKADKKLVFPKFLLLEKVILKNGNLNLSIQNQLNLAIKGLNVDVEKFSFPDQTDTDFSFQNLTFDYDNLIAQIDNNKYQFISNALTYKNQELMLNKLNGSLSSGNASQFVEFSTNYLKLQDFDLKHLISEKEISLSTFHVDEPFLSGTIQASGKSADENPNLPKLKSIPVTFNIDTLKVSRGGVDAVVNLKNEKLKVVSSYNAKVGELKAVKGDSIQNFLEKLLWQIDLSNSKFEFRDHEINFKLLQTNSFRSEFKIDSLSVKSDLAADSLNKKLKFRKIEVPFIDISGLDYKLFLIHDSLNLQTLKMADATLDVVLPKVKNAKPVNPNHKLDFRQYLLFRYDTISLTNLSLKIEQPGDTAYNFYGLQDFNFSHVSKDATGLNLIKNLGFGFELFSFTDTISGKYLNLSKGYMDQGISGFTLEGIEGGTRSEKQKESLEKSKAFIQYKSSQIKFQNVFIKEGLPSAIRLGRVDIGNLVLDYQEAEKEISRKTNFSLNLSILKRFTKVMSRLLIDTTNLNDLSVNYSKQTDTVAETFDMKSIAIVVNKINVDTVMANEDHPRLIERMTIDLRGKSHITRDSLYEIRTGKLYYDFPKHLVTIDSLFVKPRYPDSLFFDKAIYQTDRLDLFGRKIEIDDIDVDALLSQSFLHFGSINFYDFDVKMYRNKKGYEIKPGLYKPLPREAIMAISQKFAIDSIQLINSRLAYKQFDPKSEQPGDIFLSDFNITAYNITNKLEKDDHESRIKINLDAKIMGESKMEFTFFFPLYKDSTAFWLSGKTEDISMAKLNSMTKNLLGIGITNGVGSVEVPLISGNDSVAKGSLLFKYKKLRLAMYNREKEELNTSFFSPVINFFINDLVLRSNNPRFARRTKIGVAYFKRDTRKSIVNYSFKSLLSGMLYTLGINNKGQRQEKKELKQKP